MCSRIIPCAMPETGAPSLKLTFESMAPVGTNKTRFSSQLAIRGRSHAVRTDAAHPQPLPPE